ncbi:NAD(P)/FAD-dependent oxidoreductase [Vreelandella titanicae]|nr:FAD-dependent oxidoreductase [Halomonas titanicae]
MSETCIIIGASHAAAQLAPSLRQEGWAGLIIVIGDEPYAPYQRPPLSKTYLQGEKGVDDLLIRHQEAYAKHGIELRLGERVEAIDRESKTVTLQNGDVLYYDKLALCTGARVRKVSLPGADLEGIHYLRNIDDVNHIKAHVGEQKNAVIVGGGYIGLETAAVLNKLGMQVTVLEMASRVLARVTAPEVSEFYERVHAEEGVNIQTGIAVSGFEGAKRVMRVVCADGSHYPADLVVIGVGVLPNTELAEAADLATDDGILVDSYTKTADPDIVAVGDCTMHPSELYGYVRLESVPNAMEQAKSAAATLCGKQKPYTALPWFWSDQYDLKLQIAGLNRGYDQVVIRGDRQGSRSFAAFYLQEGRLLAVDCVNRPQEFMLSKRLITQQIQIDVAKLVDDTKSFKELVSA